MNGNAELLNFICQNSAMGITTIRQLLDIVRDEPFKLQLNAQLTEYQEIHDEAKQMLLESGSDAKELSAPEKLRTYLMIGAQTLTDKTPAHIAEMMIIGSNMGILDATKRLKKYEDADKPLKRLMERLLKTEEENVQRLKDFL